MASDNREGRATRGLNATGPAAAVAAALAGGVTAATASTGGEQPVYACVSKLLGTPRMVDLKTGAPLRATSSCNALEYATKVLWNVNGPPSVKGDAGAQGAKGETGAAGARGATGPAGARGETGSLGPDSGS
jgi:hypothetical protein